MRRSVAFLTAVLFSITISAQEEPTDKEMILKTIDTANVQGLPMLKSLKLNRYLNPNPLFCSF
jgi:hypothetical protein